MARTLQLYRSYSFREKDPIIDHMRTIIEVEGVSYKKVTEQSGVSSTCLHGWFRGQTKRPQFCTIMAVARSLGYDLELRPQSKRTRTQTAQVIAFDKNGRLKKVA